MKAAIFCTFVVALGVAVAGGAAGSPFPQQPLTLSQMRALFPQQDLLLYRWRGGEPWSYYTAPPPQLVKEHPTDPPPSLVGVALRVDIFSDTKQAFQQKLAASRQSILNHTFFHSGFAQGG